MTLKRDTETFLCVPFSEITGYRDVSLYPTEGMNRIVEREREQHQYQ